MSFANTIKNMATGWFTRGVSNAATAAQAGTKVGLLGKVLGGTAAAGAVAGGAAAVSGGLSGADGLGADINLGIQGALKNPDAVSDVDNFFTRVARFIQNCVKLVTNLPAIAQGKFDALSMFSGNNPDAPADGSPVAGSPDAPGNDLPAVPEAAKPTVAAVGNAYNSASTALEEKVWDSVDQGNPHLATAATVAGVGALGLGAKALLGGSAAGAAAPAAAAAAGGGLAATLFGTTTFGKAIRVGAVLGAGAIGLNAADDAQPVATTPHAPAPVSITENPGGFITDAVDGVKSLFKTGADGRNQLDLNAVGDAVQNNAKAAALGAGGTVGWIAGQATDLAESVENFFGATDFIDGSTDYSTKWSADFTDTGMDLMNAYAPGGAPDMNSSWAQAASFGGGMIIGGGAVKGLSIAGRLTSLFTTQAAQSGTTAAMSSAPAMGPALRMAP